MKKKTLILLLCALLAFSVFAACGNKNDTSDAKKEDTTNKNNPADKVAEGVGDAAKGVANATNDVWEGFVSIFKGDKVPKTVAGTKEVFAKDYGIDESLLDSYTLRTAEGENNASEFFIAKVKEGKMSQVEQALEKRKTAIAEKWKASTDESMAYAKEPVIIKSGNYIMLAVHSDLTNAKAEFEKLTKDL
ncbi:MAG: DUF4358 domain-containing protein [Clostridiaceae bacterium]|nr:DUF4358 domain-containing protein [Clostridiaceae bacterium]